MLSMDKHLVIVLYEDNLQVHKNITRSQGTLTLRLVKQCIPYELHKYSHVITKAREV